MQLNYIVLAHKNPTQLKRLVQRLYENWTFFYIHIDCNIDISPFKEAIKDFKNVKFFINSDREYCSWGGYGLVLAALKAFQYVDHSERGYTILLSAQHYPLRNNEKIKEYLKNIYPKDVISINSFPEDQLNRIKKYRVDLSNKKYSFVQYSSIWDRDFYTTKNLKAIYSLIIRDKLEDPWTIFRKRKNPKGITPMCGSQWWMFSNKTVKNITEFLAENPKYLKFHEYTLVSDETFFQTIIHRFLEEKKISEVENTLTYVNWNKKGVSLPVTFSSQDFKELKKAIEKDFLFARKFDIEIDEAILNSIDNYLLNYNQ